MEKRNVILSNDKSVRLSKVPSLFSGLLVIIMALCFRSLCKLSLFDLMMPLSDMVQLQILIPLNLGIFIRRTSNWALWATVALGLFVSWFILNVFTPAVLLDWMGLEPLALREKPRT